jgi:hypothetical protein
MAYQTDLTADPYAEKSTQKINFTVEDEDGNAVQPETLTVTLYNQADGAIINSRNAINILNANGGSVSAGVGYWIMDPDDNAIVNDARDEEIHVALFEWTWNSGQRGAPWEVLLNVRNLAKVS